ncbi:unnamed protein product, partial [Amoebophrya sp. A120]|eukprot:GSA120T00001481001.1
MPSSSGSGGPDPKRARVASGVVGENNGNARTSRNSSKQNDVLPMGVEKNDDPFLPLREPRKNSSKVVADDQKAQAQQHRAALDQHSAKLRSSAAEMLQVYQQDAYLRPPLDMSTRYTDRFPAKLLKPEALAFVRNIHAPLHLLHDGTTELTDPCPEKINLEELWATSSADAVAAPNDSSTTLLQKVLATVSSQGIAHPPTQ